MIVLIKNMFAQYSGVLKNSFFLSIVDGIKLLLPFVAMPYIIHICGIENFGKIVFTQTVMAYFSMAVNLGLNIFSVGEVAKNSNDLTAVSNLASSFIVLRLLVVFLCFTILLFMLAFIPFMQQFRILMLYAFIAVLAEAFTMTAFFQGLEKMHNIAVLQFFAVIFYISTLLIFVKKADDYVLVPLLQSSGLLISSLLGVGLLCARYKLRLHFPAFSELKKMLWGSSPFAVSIAATVINSNIARLFAGISLGMHDLALLDITQKIAEAAMIPINIVDQALYPHNAKKRDKHFANITFFGVFTLGIFCALSMITGSPYAVNFFGQGELNDAAPLVCWLGIKVIFNAVSAYTGTPVLVAFGYAKTFSISLIWTSVISLLLYTTIYISGILSLHVIIAIMIFDSLFIAAYRLFCCVKYKLLFYTS